MKELYHKLSKELSKYFQNKYNISLNLFDFQLTRKEFDGDITLVVYPILKYIKLNPQVISKDIGEYLINSSSMISSYNIISGFLNFTISNNYYIKILNEIIHNDDYGLKKIDNNSKTIIVEFSSPNTNKPLHLGHIRNNLLGDSVAKILEANGNKVVKTQIINDRGIHICKSMVSWELYGNGDTPEKLNIKGDKFVGDFYVLFEKKYRLEINRLIKKGHSEEYAKNKSPILLKAKEMLSKWEIGEKEVISLWNKMNKWVYKGFDITYKKLGITFDSNYYESMTYLLGKKIIEKGINKNVFFRKDDGSVWIDLKSEGLDEKLLLRSDGTSVYMTQDLGTAVQRYNDNPSLSGMVYTVGNEQDYHFKVLFLILKKLGFVWADSLHHLSYGMVDLPDGKMKSREGNIVDADELINKMKNTAKEISKKLGKLDGLSVSEKNNLYDTIGLGALKYYILKVDPKKRILFDPEKSIDFSGNTGPFIQYTYARIRSIIRNSSENFDKPITKPNFNFRETNLIKHLLLFPELITQSSKLLSPSLIANYLYELVKLFNSFYQNVNILGEKNEQTRKMRIILTKITARNIKKSCGLLGIKVPEKM
ncbi:MAG: arginine--tRNA ligase [Flavobacteriaceae bacterium TMED220]|nr:MAG: arginine--tRNA ligase [Flavobacteriaceae bacterium TMED220]